MINITDANTYFESRLFNEEWINADNTIRQSALTTSENMLLSHVESSGYLLIDDAKNKSQYLHAVCEQAIHLLQFDKERYKLQNEGVVIYRVEDVNIHMNNALISSVALSFLKTIVHKKVGRIV